MFYNYVQNSCTLCFTIMYKTPVHYVLQLCTELLYTMFYNYVQNSCTLCFTIMYKTPVHYVLQLCTKLLYTMFFTHSKRQTKRKTLSSPLLHSSWTKLLHSAEFEPADLCTKGQHATSRTPKPLRSCIEWNITSMICTKTIMPFWFTFGNNRLAVRYQKLLFRVCRVLGLDLC